MAIMGVMDRCTFSESGQYFACYNDDGKLRVWEAETGVLKQEYTPNFHLGSPGTCLQWLKLSLETITPKKKKKIKSSEQSKETDVVAIGTSSGSIHLYCIASGSVLDSLEGGPTTSVNCLSWSRGTNLFSCAGETIVEWGVGCKTLKRWKAGKDVVTYLRVLPDGNFILSASRSIILWSLPKHERLKTYSGHASDVTALVYVPPASPSSESYFISAAKTDRYLSAWSLSVDTHNTNVAQFLMEDAAAGICVCPGIQNDSTTMCAVARSGVLHTFKLQLNGKCAKPIKPKLTVQIAARSSQSQNKEAVMPIPIVGATLCDSNTIHLVHGTIPFLVFEKISCNTSERELYLVREDAKKATIQKKGSASKVVAPEVDVDAQYISSLVSTSTSASKRGHKTYGDVPMEERLNNLTLNRSDSGVPHADNVAHLLLQGLRSKDKRTIHTVLLQRDEAVIKRTVARLPVQVVVPLVEELASLMQGKVVRCQVAAQWLRAVIGIHASQILSSPGAMECFAPVLGLVETRLEKLTPLSRLRGRLDLLMDQLTAAQVKNTQLVPDSQLVYQDSYSSDEDIDDLADDKVVHSDFDENWDDLSDPEESEMQDGELDAEMSVD
ncbi:WD repeat-containing protein 43 [Gryllus bimaculatus]|nr:WD repeat-containing protein 43 [Gryllus bimaculatus]